MFEYNSHISWSIVITFAISETEMNTPQPHVIYCDIVSHENLLHSLLYMLKFNILSLKKNVYF